MRARRVIFVNRVYWPAQAATAQLLTDLAEELAARGHDVHVIAAGSESGVHHGVTIHRTGGHEQNRGLLSRVGNYLGFLHHARRKIGELAQPRDIVVLKTDPPLLGALGTSAALRAGAQVVHWIQDIYPEIVSAHLGAAFKLPLAPLSWLRDRAWHRAAACVTLGTDMATTLQAHAVAPSKIHLVPNWAPRELHEPPAAAAIRARRLAWGLDDKFIVVYSGNLGRVHEFDAIIDAATQLKDAPGIAFLLIGRGARFDEVRTEAERRGLPNLHFLPPEPRADLPAALAAADVHLVTLRPAFLPLVYPSKLAGVLAAGRPVAFIGPRESEIARLLTQDGCGEGFSPRDGSALAERLHTWQRQPTLTTQLGRAARAAYEKRFTFRAAVSKWEELLRSV